MTMLADLEEFIVDHRSHGTYGRGRHRARVEGYLLTVACPCGVTFERWVTPLHAAEDSAIRGPKGETKFSNPERCLERTDLNDWHVDARTNQHSPAWRVQPGDLSARLVRVAHSYSAGRV